MIITCQVKHAMQNKDPKLILNRVPQNAGIIGGDIN